MAEPISLGRPMSSGQDISDVRGQLTPRELQLRRLSYLMVLIVPILCIIAAIMIFWNTFVGPGDIAILITLYLASALGVSAGYHRLLTHRSYRTYPTIRYALAVLGSMSVEGPPTEWVATHRKHHALADQFGDPHSPHEYGPGMRGALRGLAHAHAGWYLRPMPAEEVRHYAPDMLADRGMRWIDRNQPIIILSGLALPFALGFAVTGTPRGGLSALVWGGLVRIFLVHHVVRSIDSICHFFGARPFPTNDRSRNVGWLSLFSVGESWHNTHHAFPSAAYFGIRRVQIDISGACIRGLERCRLAWHVGRITPELLERRRAQQG
jgi:stearoyl-CoA desaturase (Delta-9 desaturase)